MNLPPFDTMIARIAALEIADGVGVIISFTDGKLTKHVWCNLTPNQVRKIVEGLVNALPSVDEPSTPTPTSGAIN